MSLPQSSGGRLKRPFVLINMAMTADAKIATASRKTSSFGSGSDQRHMLELRATAHAVMAGARTIDSAPVTMGPGGAEFRRLRLRRGLPEYPLRIVVSRTASIRPDAVLFQRRFSPIIVLTTEKAPARRREKLASLAEVRCCGGSEIDWDRTLQWLLKERGVKRLLCEGGGELNDALFRRDLVDELHVTVCPFVFGGATAPTISDGAGTSHLAGAARFVYRSHRQIGRERFFVFRA